MVDEVFAEGDFRASGNKKFYFAPQFSLGSLSSNLLCNTSSVLLRKPPSPAGEGFRGFGFFYAPLCAAAQFSLGTDTAPAEALILKSPPGSSQFESG